MAYLQLKSTNPMFSHVIGKNPATGMQVRKNRQGRFFGWYSGLNSIFNIWFKDSETEVSYKAHSNESFEFVNTSRYDSAMIPINALTEFFAATVKKLQPDDAEGFKNTLVINMMKIKNSKAVEIFQQHLPEFELTVETRAHKSMRVTITTEKTVRELLNYANLFCLYNVLKNTRSYQGNATTEDYFDVNDDTVAKYLKCLEVIDPPYFVRYVFKIHLLRGTKMFGKYKDLFETTKNHDSIELKFGDTSLGRRNAVKGHLEGIENNVVDIGCGEGFYALDILKKMPKTNTYYGIDTDESCIDRIAFKAKKRDYENLKTYSSYNEFLEKEGDLRDKPVDVILAEVIEHMSKDDAETMITATLGFFNNLKNFIITTPNKDFNKFYDMSEDHVRHEDHQFEMTEDEFRSFIESIICGRNGAEYSVQLFYIGDKVDGIPTSLGAHIRMKKDD